MSDATNRQSADTAPLTTGPNAIPGPQAGGEQGSMHTAPKASPHGGGKDSALESALFHAGQNAGGAAAARAPSRLLILISGRGSNMRTLVEACRQEGWPAQVVGVIANKPEAAGLAWAREQGLETLALPHREYPSREAFDAALAQAIDTFQPDYVILAGFMRVLTPGFVQRYAGRLVNIHPSLLPAFPGLHTHAQALANGVQVHGCTVHFVTPVLDHGPIIAQSVVPVLAEDTPEALAERVLETEHQIFPRAVRWLVEGRVSLAADGRVAVAGVPSRLYIWQAGEVNHG